MADFIHEAFGKICVSSWVAYRTTKVYHTKYSERDIVYDIKKAYMGELEKVAIKRIEFFANSKTDGQMTYLYIDTYNSYWREDMLCEHSSAIALARDFYIHRITEYRNVIRDNGNSCLP
jgi:hypothetical protein